MSRPERRLDLGSGSRERSGFIGLDRFRLPGVQVLANLDAPHLPFADDSFDLILAFHSVEHAADAMSLMREIWRVGRAGAQVCIAGPCGSQGLNLANPYHHQVLNEHTPRFWTACPTSPIDPAEYRHPPQGVQWGLARSDHSDPGFDLRCLRMEFFYFEEYWRLSPEEQRRLRKTRLDVCDQVLYHLLVFKPPLTERDSENVAMDFYMPPELEERRAAAEGVRARGWKRWLLPHPPGTSPRRR
jgi:SAM-dependent methyltransferase